MVFRSCSEPLPSLILSIRLRSSEVPTRHGVQKPQLSCAKKCAKCRATSNMSRLPSNTMNAPPVSMSSKAMRRSNSSWPMHMPDGPPTCTAIASARRSRRALRARSRRAGIRRCRAGRSRPTPRAAWCRRSARCRASGTSRRRAARSARRRSSSRRCSRWWGDRDNPSPRAAAAGCAECRACPRATRPAPRPRRRRRSPRRGGPATSKSKPACPQIVLAEQPVAAAALERLEQRVVAGSDIRRAGTRIPGVAPMP